MDKSPWIIGLCHVVFDVDYGQKVKALVPEDALSEEEQQDVGFHAFPDCMSMEVQSRSSVRDSSFFFRIPRRGLTSTSKKQGSNNSLTEQGSKPKYIYGFVFCRQRMDASLKRGGEQSSVVVLSEQPFSSALKPLSQVAGPLFYNIGPAALRQVWQEVLMWPHPVSGPLLQLTVDVMTISVRLPAPNTLPLPVLPTFSVERSSRPRSLQIDLARRSSYSSEYEGSPGSRSNSFLTPRLSSPMRGVKPKDVNGVDIPVSSAADGLVPWPASSELWGGCGVAGAALRANLSRGSRSNLAALQDSSELATGIFAEADLWSPFLPVLQRLWTLWELVLLGQPLMVVAPSPGECSAVVAALVSMIAPLPYACDFRPYYTIQDATCRQLISGALPNMENNLPTIIGITNPYFIKALQHWPNVLSVGTKSGSSTGPSKSPIPSPFSSPLRTFRQRRQGFACLLQEHTPQLWIQKERLCKFDNQQLLRLVQPKPSDPKAKTRAAKVNSEELHKYFHALTSELLSVFKPYIEAQPDSSHVRHWDEGEFLTGLRQPDGVPSLVLERLGNNINQAAELYSAFLESHNFKSWFERRREAVAHLLPPETQVMGSRETPGSLHPHMDEVSLVEAFFRTERALLDAQEAAQQPGEAGNQRQEVDQLKVELQSLFAAMPEDLQQTMLSSPMRRELLCGMQPQQRMEPLLSALHATLQVQS